MPEDQKSPFYVPGKTCASCHPEAERQTNAAHAA
jgi:UPF0176 protein